MTRKIAIIGTGQQGASIAKALSEAGGYEVSAYDANPDISKRFKAEMAGFKNVTNHGQIETVATDADIIILATPIDKFGDVLDQLNGYAKDGVIVTDVGSGKQVSVKAMKEHALLGSKIIGAHGINGKDGIGPETSTADMYRNQSVVIVPNASAQDAQIEVEKMWKDMGGNITYMSPFTHDAFYGTISHFEHPLAFALTAVGQDTLMPNHASEDYKEAGNTVLDTTRISRASAPMWIAIFKDNNAAIQKAAQGFENKLTKLKQALQADSPDMLKSYLQKAHDFRSQIPDRPRESVLAEAADIAEQKGHHRDIAQRPQSLMEAFDEAALTSLAKRTTVPIIVSAALTLNAIETEKELKGVSIIESANPSFKDGSAAMLTDPGYLADLLYYNKDELLKQLCSFEGEYNTIMDAIRSNDAQVITDYIDKVAAIRSDMPAHKSADDMRGEYVVNAPEDDIHAAVQG